MTFETTFSSNPTTSKDLFETTRARLDDIKHDVERGTFSFRELFSSGEMSDGRRKPVHESLLQKWLAHELRLRSRGHYSVDREPEEDDMNRPDIRLSCGGIGPISVELKWADNWSAKQLKEAVTDQLIGQYMRDRHGTHGVFLIARNEKLHWRTNGPLMHLDALIEWLQQVANERVRELGLGGVHVCALDFAPPVGSTAARKREENRTAHKTKSSKRLRTKPRR